MFCENIFCIYWADKKCTLNNISLDIQGKCEDCIYINIDEKVLRKQRDKLMKTYEKEKSD